MKAAELRCQNRQCKRHNTIVRKEQYEDYVIFIDGTCPYCQGSILYRVPESERPKSNKKIRMKIEKKEAKQ